jgi:hypothetical protein
MRERTNRYRTKTERLYGPLEKLKEEEDLNLVCKVEEELRVAGYEEVTCCACDRTKLVTSKEAEENRKAKAEGRRGDVYYCGCGDE